MKLMKKTKKKTPQQLRTLARKRCVLMAKNISKHLENYACCYCGVGRKEGKQVHSHHIFHEGINVSMSADPDNLITLCARHHATGLWNKTNGFNFHASPAEAMEWFKEKYPERYETLKLRSRLNQHIDWEKKLTELKGIYFNLIN